LKVLYQIPADDSVAIETCSNIMSLIKFSCVRRVLLFYVNIVKQRDDS